MDAHDRRDDQEKVAAALKRMGITTAGALGQASKDDLKREFGVRGEILRAMGNGVHDVTSTIAYLRLHGRNKHLMPIVSSMASMSSTIYIQFNNCRSGSALTVKMMQYLFGLDLRTRCSEVTAGSLKR